MPDKIQSEVNAYDSLQDALRRLGNIENAHVIGAIIAVMALAAIFAFQDWEEWVSMALGAWLIVSPWVLGFSAISTAMLSHVLIGIAALVLAIWSSAEHGSHLPAGR